jgi:hypothetical protein
MQSDRHTHLDLLAQVANSEHERDTVRRILGEAANQAIDSKFGLVKVQDCDFSIIKHGAYSISAIDYRAHTDPRLCSRCEEGLSACMTPEACRLAEPDTARPQLFARYGLLLSVAIVAGIAWAVFA